jgi:hypothetical protein
MVLPITIPKGNYTVQISYLGYLTISESISLNQNIKNNLFSNETALQEVIINIINKIDISKPEMSVNKLHFSYQKNASWVKLMF